MMAGVRRPSLFLLLLAVAAFALAAACSWPLLRSAPAAGAWVVAVAAGYCTAALAGAAVSGRPDAAWLLACGLLWAGSAAGAARPLAILATCCWAALWIALPAGAVLLSRDAAARSPAALRARERAADCGDPRGGLGWRGITLTAGSVAAVSAVTSLVLADQMGRWADQWWPGPDRETWAVVTQGLCAAAVPAAVGVAAWRRRSARAGVSALIAELASPPTVEGVQSALRAALDDPTVAVFYQLPDGSGFVSATGEPVGVPASGPGGRLVFPVRVPDGGVVAMLSADGAASVDAGRVRIALNACGPALENARLQAVLNSHLRAARASRARIVRAAVAERRKLARDLHDGAQQHLYALSTSLVLARQQTSQPEAVAAIDAAREQLRGALRKLRGIGRDLYPVQLDSEGLAAALDSLADDGPLDVDVTCETGRRDPEAEMVMYLTVREILAGLAEHLKAARAAVVVVAADGRLSLRVTSDGRLDSGAPPPWLSAVIDRIEADGGSLGVKSSADQIAALGGICMEAWIPFA
jgi:signal transduction histidine kinase